MEPRRERTRGDRIARFVVILVTQIVLGAFLFLFLPWWCCGCGPDFQVNLGP